MSPAMWRSNAAYAPPSSYRLASTQETIGAGPSAGTLATTFVQLLPPSRVTCTLPSSVPAQMTCALRGDSLIAYTVVFISAAELSTVTPPDSSCFCFSGSLVERSGEMRSHDCPLSRDRYRNCEPR